MARLLGCIAFLIALTAAGVVAADQFLPERLRIGLLPGESAPTVLRLDEPMRAYLEKRLGLPDIDDPAVLELFGAARFVPAADADFEQVRVWIGALKADRSNQ